MKKIANKSTTFANKRAIFAKKTLSLPAGLSNALLILDVEQKTSFVL
jgi:hypothetical protein